jgi:hypothetical protein
MSDSVRAMQSNSRRSIIQTHNICPNLTVVYEIMIAGEVSRNNTILNGIEVTK